MNKHDSQRGWFAYELYQQMKNNENIWLLVGDLGYKVFDHHFKFIPDRTINTGAAEIALIDIAVGLALKGKIPFVYSITPFLLWRPAESIRLYLNHEKMPVRMVGSGRDNDYKHDGFSHDATDAKTFLGQFSNIASYWPSTKEQIPDILDTMIKCEEPAFISLKR